MGYFFLEDSMVLKYCKWKKNYYLVKVCVVLREGDSIC